jgi:sugar phosphate isomerase/epimerase
MKFGITNLAWEEKDVASIENQLKKFDYFETVFLRRNIGSYYSTQSIFYGSNIKSFSDDNVLEYLNFVIDECLKCGIKIIVFGSPSLRKGNKNILLKIFDLIDNKLKESKIYLCVEPNSKYYGGEYYHSLDEIVPDIEKYSNVKTMIDTHNLILEGENIIEQYKKYSDYIKHIHISEKDLQPIEDWNKYYEFVDFLKKECYNYGITYELKPNKNITLECKKFLNLKE